ncbi:MAG TPA: hypothetical protein VMF55_15675 [Solirubrobacterales bacterium]|nr:hypothetical protein [Solirubrobacterales bacterium]
MRIDLSDLDRLEGIAEALGRFFWCLVAVAFFTAILGSAGTGLLVLILGAAGFVAQVGLQDFVRARRGGDRSGRGDELRSGRLSEAKVESEPEPEPEFTVYRSPRRARRARRARRPRRPRSTA